MQDLSSLASLVAPKQIKPDGVQRGLIGKIIARFEEKGKFVMIVEML